MTLQGSVSILPLLLRIFTHVIVVDGSDLKRLRAYRSTRRVLVDDEAIDFLELNMEFELPVYAPVCEPRDAIFDTSRKKCFRCPDGCILSSLFEAKMVAQNLLPKFPEIDCICGLSYEEIQLRSKGLAGMPGFIGITRVQPHTYDLSDPPTKSAYGLAVWQTVSLMVDLKCHDNVTYSQVYRRGFNGLPLGDSLWWLQRFDTAYGLEDIDTLLANVSQAYNDKLVTLFLPLRTTRDGIQRQLGPPDAELLNCELHFPLLSGAKGEKVASIPRVGDVEERRRPCTKRSLKIVRRQINAVMTGLVEASRQTVRCQEPLLTSYQPDHDWRHIPDLWGQGSKLTPGRVRRVGTLLMRNDFHPKTNIRCVTLRKQLRLRAMNMMQRALSYTGTDAANGCWEVLESVATFSMEKVWRVTGQCAYEPTETQYWTSPCCNKQLLRIACCAVRNVSIDQPFVNQINTSFLAQHVHVDPSGGASYAKRVAMTALAWRRRLSEGSGSPSCHRNWAIYEQAHIDSWRSLDRCHADIMGRYDRKTRMFVGLPCLVDSDCYTECIKPRIHTLQTKVRLLSKSKVRRQILGRCRVPTTERHKYLVLCLVNREGDEIRELLGEELGLPVKDRTQTNLASALDHASRKTNDCIGPYAARGMKLNQEECLKPLACNWNHEISTKETCERLQHNNMEFCSCREGWCPQLSLKAGCITTQIQLKDCEQARSFLAKQNEFECVSSATSSIEMERCNVIAKWHDSLLQKCRIGRCYPPTTFILRDELCYEAFRQEFNSCYDKCNIPSGPNPLLNRRVCYLELLPNETAEQCFQTPGDAMVHYRPDNELLDMKWPQQEKAQYCSIRIWNQLQDIQQVRNRLHEDKDLQNVNSEATAAAILQQAQAERQTYLARVAQMRNPARPADCEMGELPMSSSAKALCRSRSEGCCLSPYNTTLAYCDACVVVNTTVCSPGDKVFARWARNGEFYGGVINKDLGNDMAQVNWDDGTQFYRDVPWPHVFTYDGIACAPESEGCASHHQCKDTQYCMSCSKCAIEYGGNPPAHLCAPCPAYRGGACRDFDECQTLQSSIDGQCIRLTDSAPCQCKSEWEVRGEYLGAPSEETIQGCYFDVNANMRWCEVNVVGNCEAQRRLGATRYIYWNTCEPDSCAYCQCDCSPNCVAYDVLPVLGRLPESLGVRVGAGNQITHPISHDILRFSSTVAPNCSTSGAAYIRGVCTFCVVCCADMCHSLAIGVPPGTTNATVIALAEQNTNPNVWDCTATNISGCINVPRGWTDSVGRSCNDYRERDLCTLGGLYGKSWPLIPPTTFQSYESNGKIATDVCCECGGGMDCTNIPLEWMDVHGRDCEEYSTRKWCLRGGYGSEWNASWGAFPLGTGGIDALSACCDCGGGRPLAAREPPTLHLVSDGATCQTVWPGRAKWNSPPWIAKSNEYCRKASNICMRKLMAYQYDPTQGKNVPDDPRIYGLCEQRDFITGVFSFKEDFEQSLLPPGAGGRRLATFYQVAHRWLSDFAKSIIRNGSLVNMDLYLNSGNGMCYYRLPDPFGISGGPNREDMPAPWLPHHDRKQIDVFTAPGLSYLGWPLEFWPAMPDVHLGTTFETVAARSQAFLENDPAQINPILRVLIASNDIEVLPHSEKEIRNNLWLYAYESIQCAGEVNEYAKYSLDRTWQPAKLDSERDCVVSQCNVDSDFIGSNGTLCANARGCTKPCVYCASEVPVTQEQGVCYTSLNEYVVKCAELGGVVVEGQIFDEHLGVSRSTKVCAMLHMPLVYCTVPGFDIKRCINFDEDHCEEDPFAKLMRCALDIRPCPTENDCEREGRCSDVDAGLTWILPETCVVTPMIDELVQRQCDSETGLCFFRLDSPFGMEARKLHDLLDLLPHGHLDAKMADLNKAGRPLFVAPEDSDRLLTNGRLNQTECSDLQAKLPQGHKTVWLERARTAKECTRWQSCCMSRFGDRCSLFSGPIYDKYDTSVETMSTLMDSCSKCGGEWIDVFTWSLVSGWTRGSLVDSGREWYERKFTSANAWADVVDLDAFREVYENTLETYIGKRRRDAVECLLEPLLVALETVAFATEADETPSRGVTFPAMPSSQFSVGSVFAVGDLRSKAFIGNLELAWHEWSVATVDLGSSNALYSFFVEPFELSLASAGTQLSLPGRPELVRSRMLQHVLAPERTTTPLPAERAVLRVGDQQGYPPWLINEMLKLERPNNDEANQAALFLDEAERKRIRLEMEEKAKADADAASGLPEASKNLLLNQMPTGTPAYKSAGLDGLFNNPCRSVVASAHGEVIGEILGDCVHITSSVPLVTGVELCMPLLFTGETLKNTSFGQQLDMVLDFARKDRVPSNYSVAEPPVLSTSAGRIPGEVAFRMWQWQSSLTWGRLPPDSDYFVPLNLMTRLARGSTMLCADIFETNVTYCPIARLNTSFFARLPRKVGEPELPPPDSACPSLDFLLSAVQGDQVALKRTEARYTQSDMTASDPGLMKERGQYESIISLQTDVRGLPSCPAGSGLVFEGQVYRCG